MPDSHTFMAYVMDGGLLSCLLRRLMAFFISSIIELSIWQSHGRPTIPARIRSHRICAGPFLSCAGVPLFAVNGGPVS